MPSPLPLIIAAGAAVILLGGKKKSTKGTTKDGCPAEVIFDTSKIQSRTISSEDEESEINVPERIFIEVESGNRDIIDISYKVLSPLINKKCFTSKNVIITVIKKDIDPELSSKKSYPAPEFFMFASQDFLEDIYDLGLFNESEIAKAKKDIADWSVKNKVI